MCQGDQVGPGRDRIPKQSGDLGGHSEETGSGDLDGQAIAEAGTHAQ